MSIKNWGIFAFVAGYHVLLIALVPAYLPHFSWASVIFFAVTWAISVFSITAGYHRLFSHNTYKAKPVYEWGCLLSSSLAVEASALQWSHDHRIHHSHVDTDKDPYSIKKGFWYAHMWWMFTYDEPIDERLVKDLMKNPRVMFQHRHYILMTAFVNLAVFGLGCLFMHPVAALFASVARLFAIHHCTWFINSLCHVWGARTYAKELSAVDNAILAIFTFGEGYHNYHHTMANDYRNGVRWYHFDPTKWLIWLSSKLGLVSDLRWVNDVKLRQILVKKDKSLLMDRIRQELDETSKELQHRLEHLSESFESKAAALMAKLKEMRNATEERRKLLEIEVRQLKHELHAMWKSWISLTEFMSSRYELGHAH
ncbi:fatty acid desaturase [Pelagicoccus sp. SDUM812003]|uniref:fatty acid desaturase n=1 Tax=Pelagicoccus sp. SDUM812003 TaxID=3041267 RepID=UPI00280E1668|nr:fatty acid desaturase [Pelagicoccus sp. SDUM812003]MDQ8205552.1 fatty acid desaturase [Pelagicoccus sp. SDUM812003]